MLEKVRDMFNRTRPSIPLPEIMSRIENRQPKIDQAVRQSKRQVEEVQQELDRRILSDDPGVRFREQELAYWLRHRTRNEQ